MECNKGDKKFYLKVEKVKKLGEIVEIYRKNPALIDKILTKKRKFGDNPYREVEANNCHNPRAPNDKCLHNDSMNALIRDLQECLP